ncbi:MAG: Flp family type IVb pilin [Clostridia bacterium]|nr:Flp family type IVb pilin [Clostridia bacterium]
MVKMMELARMLKVYTVSKKGQGMVEYGLIIALIAVVAIVGLNALGPQIRNLFQSIAGQINPGQ